MTWIAQVSDRAKTRLTTARRTGVVPDFRREHPDRDVLVVDQRSTVDDGIPPGIRVAGAWAWRIVLFILAAYLLLRLIGALRLMVIPVVVALLLAALLEPAAAGLRKRGVPRSLAAALVLVGGLVVVFGSLGVIVQTFIAQFDSLTEQVTGGVNEIRGWLSRGPLHISKEQIDSAIDGIGSQLSANRGALTSGALTTATTITEVLTGFFVVLFTLFFFLRDGGQIWEFLCRLLPRAARLPAVRAGHYSWFTLVSYVRATVLVAFVDAVGIGIGLAILRIPLALPLAALVFLGAFIPVVGATLSGAVAVLVALVTKDPLHALLVLAIVIAVQQLEGHVLQPLIMGRAVSLHPLAVILAITTGVVAAGIVGGLVAVPLLAVGNTAVRYLVAHPDGEPTPDQEPPGTQPSDVSDGGPIASEPADDTPPPPEEDLPDAKTSGSTSSHE
ncbi:AI-2E family transporter [Dactylosporangium sp. NPDC049525]|uniref:AI-2E family transporter n=1 Tax=Dactylosporangium sp. NPDC049525 TaxID=3154730 RepID=UPI00344586BD